MADKDKFVLVDAHAIIHRAYHAFPNTLKTRDGQQINAVYGFTRILLEVIEKFKPKYLVIAFDSKGPTFRHTKFKEYKGTRKKIDPELIEQFDKVKEVVDAFNIPILAKASFEADDILGTIVSKPEFAKYEKIIVTGDHDILQLMTCPKTEVYIAGTAFSKSLLYDEEAVKKRYQFGSEYITDYKGLRGDASDNIPGVKGIGEKTATELILKFGHLEEIYKALDKIPAASVQKKLEASKDIAILSKDLATIDTKVPLELDIKNSEFDDFDEEKVKEIFMRFSFASLLNKIPHSRNGVIKTSKEVEMKTDGELNYKHLKTKEEIEDFLKELKKQKIFAFDTETTGLNYTKAKVMGISISWKECEGYYIDLDTPEFNEEHVKGLKEVFENPEVRKIGHNIKFDGHMLNNSTVKDVKLGINTQNYYFDTMIAQYILTGSQGKIGLKSLAFTECGMQLSELEDLWKDVAIKVKKYYKPEEVEFMMKQLDKANLAKYASQDADATWRLYKLFEKRLEAEKNLNFLFSKIEMPIVSILVEMENEGIRLDIDYLRNFGKELEKQLAEIKAKIFKEIGHEFNVSSAKQVGEVLFGELKLPGGRKTKTGAWQTNERILMEYRTVHPVINLLLEYREVSKILSTYVESLIVEADNPEQRIHTSYNQTIASTGRLSSTKPNLQNIPVSSEVGRQIRRAFVSDKGKKLISFDISQQELRILAHLSKEEKLIEAFKKDIDIHKNTAAMLFNVPEAEITKEQRDMGKTLNYSLIYGISAYGLSDRLKIAREEAQDLIDKYFQIYPKIKQFFDEILAKAKETGKVATMYGRYRDASDLSNSNYRVRNATEREVINFPIQGSASDLMKIAMLKVDDFLKQNKKYEKLDPKLLLQVHDELVFEVITGEEIEEFSNKITKLMSEVGELIVPMKVEYHIGHNWADLK